MAFIIDASVAIGWVVGRQATAHSRRLRLRARREAYHAPTLWRLEVVNVIRSLTRRGAMSIEAGRTAVDILDRFSLCSTSPPCRYQTCSSSPSATA